MTKWYAQAWVSEHSPLSPEARCAKRRSAWPERGQMVLAASIRPHQLWEVLKRVFVGVYSEGFVSTQAIFAYFSFGRAFLHSASWRRRLQAHSGQTQSGPRADQRLFPDRTPRRCRRPARSCRKRDDRPVGAIAYGSVRLVSLWTTASLIETIRDVMHRSYGTQPHLYFLAVSALGSLGHRDILGHCWQWLHLVRRSLVTAAIEAAGVSASSLRPENVAGYFALGRVRAVPDIVCRNLFDDLRRDLTPQKYKAPYLSQMARRGVGQPVVARVH